MRILHVNDVAAVGTLLVRASQGRDALYQPALRRDLGEGPLASPRLAVRRIRDVVRLRRLFHAGPFTHLHVHYATFAHLADLAGLPYSLHVHGGDVLLDTREPLKRRLVLRAVHRARRVVVSTPDLLAPTDALRAGTAYVPNPMELLAPGRRKPGAAHPRLVVLSKMDPLKGWNEQAALLETLRRELPDLEFSFFGHGQLATGERDRLVRALAALGGHLVPPLSREGFLLHIAEHDFALGQLEVGSLGMSEMEAMALGVPTIANVSAHRAAGYRPPVIDPVDAAARLRGLWNEGAQALERWGVEARAYLERHHAPARSLRVLEALLEGDGM